MIEIKNKRAYTGAGIYCGRPTPLGNPFNVSNESQRDWSCDQYKIWFDKRVAEKNQPVMNMLDSLVRQYKQTGHLILICWCAPLRCHTETIRDYILKA